MNYYSAKANSFFPLALEAAYLAAGTWPPDAIKVDSDAFLTYALGEPPEGMQRGPGPDGKPAWVPIPTTSLDTLAARKRAEIDAASVAALADIRGEYPDYEQLSWERQEREARAGGGLLTQAIADARGMPLLDLIGRILEKVDAFELAAGDVIGKRHALWDAIDAAEAAGDRETLEAIAWPEG